MACLTEKGRNYWQRKEEITTIAITLTTTFTSTATIITITQATTFTTTVVAYNDPSCYYSTSSSHHFYYYYYYNNDDDDDNNDNVTYDTFVNPCSPCAHQDQYGDTPLHDAIDKDNADAVDMLLRAKTIDLQAENKKGFNILQHACLKGDAQ